MTADKPEQKLWQNRTPEEWANSTYCYFCGLPLLENEEDGNLFCVYCTWMEDEKYVNRDVSTEWIIKRINRYYEERGLVYPTSEQALMWAMTELGEATDELMRKSVWVRNNPEKEADFNSNKFVSELGDTIMMLIVAGYKESRDAIAAMILKMDRKTLEHKKSMGESNSE